MHDVNAYDFLMPETGAFYFMDPGYLDFARFSRCHTAGALKDHGVQISMDGKGRCMDNIFIERLWRSVKYEKIFLEEFETVPELLAGLKEYFEFYNFERPHQSLVGKTPAEIYWGRDVVKKAA